VWLTRLVQQAEDDDPVALPHPVGVVAGEDDEQDDSTDDDTVTTASTAPRTGVAVSTMDFDLDSGDARDGLGVITNAMTSAVVPILQTLASRLTELQQRQAVRTAARTRVWVGWAVGL